MSDKKDKFVLEGTEAMGIYVRYKLPYKKVNEENDEGRLVEICPMGLDEVQKRLDRLDSEWPFVHEREFYHKPVVVIDRVEYMKFKGEVE